MSLYSLVPPNQILTSGVSSALTWTNTLNPSTLNASTLNANAVTVSTLTTSSAITTATLNTSALSVSTLNIQSSIISLGQSTNQTYNNFSNGSLAAGSWITAKSSMTNANKTVQSANGLYQMIVANATSGLCLSSDSGMTWSTLSGGLPTLTGSAYWSNGAISANGQYITLSVYGGSLWMSQDYGRTFALTNQPTPNIWLPLNGNTTDSMGLSVVTATGSPSYVTVNYPGYTAQAINLANTAGGTATKYVRGTWTASDNITISLWFNAQSTGVQQTIFDTGIEIAIYTTSNQQLWYQFVSNGGITSVSTAANAIVINTWYYVTVIFQKNGTCSMYLNNTLVGSSTNIGGYAPYSSINQFSLGTYDNATTFAFNGYIDDLKITNSVSTYVPIPLLQSNIWMPFENSTADLGSNAITPTVTGSVSYVPGVVGLNAVNLANTAGSTATNYIRGALPALTTFTVSGWFNIQSWPSSGTPIIFATGTGAFIMYINTGAANTLNVGCPTGVTSGTYTVCSTSALSLNTWYHFVYVFQPGATAFYLNGVQVGSTYTAGTGVGSFSTSSGFGLGVSDSGGVTNAFNGYIDDFRIYNAAIPIHALLPQNYRAVALSGTGQYALASAASGWVVGSSNLGQTWAKQSVNVGTQTTNSTALALSYSGQYQLVATGSAAGNIMPNQTGLTSATWTQGGVTWAASASSNYVASNAYGAFDNSNAQNVVNTWASVSSIYSAAGNYTGSVSTTILGGIGAQLGEWLQIQASVPLVLQSYTYACGYYAGTIPKSYYIVGSMDGSSWYPLQYVTMTTNPITTSAPAYTRCTSYITLNTTGSITIQGNVTGSGTSTAYSYTTQPWMYFRIVCVTTYGTSTADVVQLGELYLNFSNSVSYSSNYGATWSNSSNTLSNDIVSLSPSGQYALSTNSVAPLARLTLDNTNVDAQGVLTPATGAGTVTYSSSIVKVGTHSAQFANTAGATATNYLNYTVPTILSLPTMMTVSVWVYPTSVSSNANNMICSFSNSSIANNAQGIFSLNGTITMNWATTSNTVGTNLSSNIILNSNIWTHIAFTFNGSLISLYVNGVLSGTATTSGSLSLNSGTAMTNFLLSSWTSANYAFAGYVDDVRLYTQALSAHEVASLYANPALTQSIGTSSSYLPITSYVKPILPGATANVVDAKVSQTGQYMVAVTSGTTNNVYYSTDYGATFTALTLGTTAMTACSISYDGSYLTVENATTTYTLNRNTRGFSVTAGNQAGLINQGSNAVAIGNQAGQTNQSANSIVLNASGSAVSATNSGFYVAPIANTAGLPMNLLGYGADSQVVQTGVTALPGTNPYISLGPGPVSYNQQSVIGFNYGGGVSGTQNSFQIVAQPVNRDNGAGPYYDYGAQADLIFMRKTNNLYSGFTTDKTYTEVMRMSGGTGYVGIGTTSPSTPLHVVGTVTANTFSAPGGNYLNITNGAGSGSISLQGGSILFQNSFVGIGTTAPIAPLHVVNSSAGLTNVQYGGGAGNGAQWYTVVGNYTTTTGSVLTIPIVIQSGNWSTTMFRIRGFKGTYNNSGAPLHFTAECSTVTLGTGQGSVTVLSIGGNTASVTFNQSTVSLLVNFTTAYGAGAVAVVIEYLATLPSTTVIAGSISAN